MENLTWVAHPARIRKTATVLVSFFLLVIFIVVYLISKSILMIGLAIFIFAGALSTYYFPTKYELTGEKVKIKYLFSVIEKELKNYRSYYPDKNGVLLSPFPRPSRLENFRGIFLRYHNNKAEVDAFVKKIFEARPSGPEGGSDES